MPKLGAYFLARSNVRKARSALGLGPITISGTLGRAIPSKNGQWVAGIYLPAQQKASTELRLGVLCLQAPGLVR